MELGADDSVEEQSRWEMTIAVGVQSTAYVDTEITATNAKEEPGSTELVKSEPALSVKEEVSEDRLQDIDERPRMQEASAIVGGSSVDPGNVLDIKEELGAIDIGPTVLQRMDIWYTINQPGTSVVKQGSTINGNNGNPTRCGGVKEVTIEEECRDARHSEETQPGQRAQSRCFRCDKCSTTFSWKSALRMHCRRVHATGSHECTECNLKFKRGKNLVQHMHNVHSKVRHECAGCKKVYKSKRALLRHVAQYRESADARHSEETQPGQRPQPPLHVCDKCPKAFRSKSTLREHCTHVHATGSHACTECNLTFKCAEYLFKHIRRVHSKQRYECAGCKKMYKYKQSLHRHVPWCLELGSAGSERRNYVCDYCQKTYAAKHVLQRHIDTVHANTSYKCLQCVKSFKCKLYADRHTATVHSAGSRRQFTCRNCGKNLKTKYNWQMHEKKGKCTRPTASNTSAVASTSVQQPSVVTVKEEAADGELRQHVPWSLKLDIDERPRIQEASAIVGSSSVDPGNVLDIKEELGAVDIGPTVLQRMDTSYATTQPGTSVVKQGSTINGNNGNPTSCGGVKEETIEEECRDARHSEETQPGQRAQSRLHRCDKCLKTFKSKKTLRAHCAFVHATESHACTECNIKFRCAEYLLHHMRNVHSKPRFECALCKKMYKSKQWLRQHVPRCLELGSAGSELRHYVCDYCLNAYETKDEVQIHIANVHTNTSYTCLQCNKSYRSKKYLKRHTATVHSAAMEKCNVCGKSVRKRYLRRHMLKVHCDKRVHCKLCAEVMMSKQHLHQHMIDCHGQQSADARHSEETQPGQRAQSRLHRCDKCLKTFRSKSTLREHCTRVHGTRSHACTECNSKFSCAGYLLHHVRNVHSKPRYECAGCKKMYQYKTSLRQHVPWCLELGSAGSELRHYVCDYCLNAYETKGQVQIHIANVHTKTSYKCLQCNKSYKFKMYLKRHTATVHSTAMEKCNVCGKSMKACYLRRHIFDMHFDEQVHCKLCAVAMMSKQHLHQHMIDCHRQQSADARHSEETQPGQRAQSRLHRCDKCLMKFRWGSALRMHYTRVHATGSHECPECNLKYKCATYLVEHIRNVHRKAHYECARCKKMFKYKQSLHRHVPQCRGLGSAGSERRNYVCEYCQKTYADKQALQRHIARLHANRPYKCDQCNMSFKCQRYVTMHKDAVHSAGSPRHLTCSNCGKNFTTKYNWQRHEKRGTCTRPTAGNTSAVASTSVQQRSVIMVKEEPADGELDLGPVVFQHVDCNYQPYKQEPQLD